MSFQLALTTECIPLGKNDYNLSTRTHYGVYQNSNNLKYLAIFLSTRTHYGVYHVSNVELIKCCDFQLALTTECIKRTAIRSSLIVAFNSHSLRSVSANAIANSFASILSTRTHYGVYQAEGHLVAACDAFQLALTTECITI